MAVKRYIHEKGVARVIELNSCARGSVPRDSNPAASTHGEPVG